MPIYEYRCEKCGHELEAIQKLSEAALVTCPVCEEDTLKKKISAAGFRLKGGGWYETDFKSGKKPDINSEHDRDVLDRYRRQLEVYAHLVEEREGHTVSRMHLYYTSEKDGLPHITYDRAGADLETTVETFDAVVSKIEQRNYDMASIVKTDKLCGNCDMRFHCNPVIV